MGPSVEVLTDEPITDEHLLAIDTLLSTLADKIIRTRKGRVWTLWIGERPMYVSVTAPDCVTLSAGRNSPQDGDILRQWGQRLASLLHGIASEPTK